MIVHDPKGELYDITHKARRDNMQSKILLFDPVADDSLKFNIFAKSMLPKNRNDLRAYVANAANIVFAGQQIKNNSASADGYFESAAKSTFIFFAQWLIYKNNETSIPKIRSKLLEDEDTSRTIEDMVEDNSTPAEIKEDGRGVLTASVSENQWAGIIGQLKEALELFADSRIRAVTDSTCDFTGYTLREEKTTVYLKVRDKDKQRLRPIMSLMLDSISTQLVSRMPEDTDHKITFILDEFVRLGKMDFISELPSISRGYKLNFIFVAQDYEQISNTYGQSYISIFETNCAYKIIFRQNNHNTAERISKLIGNKTTDRKSISKNQGSKTDIKVNFQGNNSKSESISREGIALVTPQDITNLKSDNCLLVVQGHASKPILAKNPMWFKEKNLKNLIN
jgi:type IV secretion system protein VirD4